MTTETSDTQQLTRGERLERLPITKPFAKLFGASGIGWALDAMDVGLVSFIVAALAVEWNLTDGEKSWILSVGFIGMAIGATLGGFIADRIGRRLVFALTLLIYGAATGLSALAGGVAVLLVLRFFTGFGLGAELPIASTLVSEYAPRKIRGRVVVWLEAFWALGWILAALIGTFVIAGSANGWRWGFVIGAIPAVYSLIIRIHTPESVRFLEAKGRFDDAETHVVEYEEAAGEEYRYDGPRVNSVAELPVVAEATGGSKSTKATVVAGATGATEGTGITETVSIWSKQVRTRTIALWIIWFMINFSYYGAFTWIPSLLVGQGFSLVRSFTFTLIITLAQVPGYAVAAWLIEVLGRRITLAVFLTGSCGSALFYGFASSEATIIAAGMLLSFFNLGAWGALYAIGPELYPTNIRGTGTGAAAGFGRIASILTPLLVPVFIGAGGNALAFAVFSAAFAIAAIAAFFLPEQKGKSIQ